MKLHRLLFTFIALAALSSPVLAQLSWTPESIPGEPTEKQKNPPPSIRVKLIGEPLPTQDVWGTFLLRHDPADVKKMPGVKPIKAIPYHKSSETLGIVLLIEGHEFYFGNNSYKQPQDCKDPAIIASGQACKIIKVSGGVYDAIRGALEAPGAKDEEIPSTISRAGPPGSKGAMIVYSAGAEKKYEGDLKNLTADKIGDQRAQEGKTSREFVVGLQMAADTLKRIGTTRKALFIFSDGFDAGDTAEIVAIKKRLDADKVEVFAFSLEAASEFIEETPASLKSSKSRLDTLAGGSAMKAKDTDSLKAHITAAVIQLNSRFTLVFPGQAIDPKTKLKAGFKWDEKEHPLQLLRGDEQIINIKASDGSEIETVMMMAPKWGQTAGGSMWWLWVVIPGGVLLLGVIIASMGKKKPAPAPPPVVVAAPVAAPPPVAAAPSNPAKTMMVNISSGDGLPVVGWIVPIQGEKQFQTFKLQYGETRIGTTSNAHIVLNDGFMSTDHAKIVMSPTGFTLVDNNSTNGTFANERRIQRHELVDNDMIMFGKTVCKFKTILGT